LQHESFRQVEKTAAGTGPASGQLYSNRRGRLRVGAHECALSGKSVTTVRGLELAAATRRASPRRECARPWRSAGGSPLGGDSLA